MRDSSESVTLLRYGRTMAKRLVITGITLGLLLAVLVVVFVLHGRGPVEHRSSAKTPEVIRTKSGIEMVLVPGGRLLMGSNRSYADESPAHDVRVDPFLMDRCEVTQEQYTKLVIGNPARFKAPRRPVEQIRWIEAAFYCNARSIAEDLEPCYDEETGQCNSEANGYRLPTEAEWEYACRAGTGSDYFFGRGSRRLKEYAWYKENASEKPHPVGQKEPNPWGMFDMYGNVAEWCNDRYDEDYYKRSPARNPRGPAHGEKYVVRGGAWNSSADSCRSAYRACESPGSFADACFAHPDIGFRCVRNHAEGRTAEPIR